MEQKNFSWLKRLEKTLVESNLIKPEWMEFDLDSFCKQFQQKIGIENLSFSQSTLGWLTPEDFEKGLGEDLVYVAMMFSPLQGEIFWAMDVEDASKLSFWLFSKDTNIKNFSSEILQEAFYRYLLLETLDLLDQQKSLKDLSAKILSQTPLPSKACFCVDIQIKYKQRSCYGRLFFSKPFLSAWKQFLPEKSGITTSPMAAKTDLILDLYSGHFQIDFADWKRVKKGDFILLDRSSFEPETKQGVGVLMLEKTPLFQIRIKQDKIKIVDYSEYKEVLMEEKPQAEHAEKVQEAPEEKNTKPSPVEDIPLLIGVRLAKIQMTLERLSQLQPGQVLELPMKIDDPAELVLNEKVIAKAELIQLGETLGARIIDLG